MIRELWRQTKVGWLGSPVPAGFRHAVVDALATHSPWPWEVVAEGIAQPVHRRELPDVGKLLAEPLPEGEPAQELDDWPAASTPELSELLGLVLRLLMDGPDAGVSRRLLKLLGGQRYASLVEMLSYLDTCRTFAQAHPDLAAAAGADYRRAGDPRQVALLELAHDGAIVSGSPAAEELFGRAAPTLVGRPLLDFVDDRGGGVERLIAALARDDAVGVREQSLKVVGHRRDGTAFDAVLTLRNRSRDGKPGRLTAMLDLEQDAGRRAQAAAYRVLVSLLEGRPDRLPPDAVLGAIARGLGWNYMLVWRLDRGQNVVRCVSIHCLAPEDKLPADVEERGARTFAPGSGMVGTVLQTHAPAWVEDLSASELKSVATGLWLPVGPDEHLEGVVELLSRDHRRPERSVVEIFGTLTRGAASMLEERPTDAAAAEAAEARADDALLRARLAFEGAPVAMALVSVESGGVGVMTEVNRAASVLTGREPSELLGRPVDVILEPEDVDIDADLAEQLLAGQIPSYVVLKRVRAADGGVLWCEIAVSLVRGENHEPRYLVVQLADVTERKRIEESIHLSRDRFASVFDEAPSGMALASLDCRWLQVNQALCEILGRDESDLVSERVSELIAPDEVETIERYLRQLMAGEVLGYHVETRAVRGDGELIWIQLSVSLVHDFEGFPAYVLAEVQDISERKRVEEELEQGALLDAVTGLPSSALLYDRLAQASARLGRTRIPFAVMFVACDGVDAVARGFGRERAEGVLREVAARLVAAVRAGDTVARYSTDEFVVVAEDLSDQEEACAIAQRILELGQFTVSHEDTAVELSATLGLTVAAGAESSPAVLVERADAAMQVARREGRRVQEYSDSS